jgi:hypothetical protein
MFLEYRVIQKEMFVFVEVKLSVIVTKPFKGKCVYFWIVTEKKVFEYTDKNILWMAEIR